MERREQPTALFYATNPRGLHYFDGRRHKRYLIFTDWPERVYGLARRNNPRDYHVLVLLNLERYNPRRRAFPYTRDYIVCLSQSPIDLNSPEVVLLKKPTLEEIIRITNERNAERQ